MKKVLIIIFLLSPAFAFADDYYDISSADSQFRQIKNLAISFIDSSISNVNDIKSSATSANNQRQDIIDMVIEDMEYYENSGADVAHAPNGDYIIMALQKMPINNIITKCDNAISSLEYDKNQLTNFNWDPVIRSVDSSSSNIVYSVDMGIVTNIYEVLAVTENNLQSIMVDMSNDLSDLLDVVGLLSSSSNTVDFTQILNSIGNVVSAVQRFQADVVMYSEYGLAAIYDIRTHNEEIKKKLYQFYDSFDYWSSVVTNFNHSSFDYSIISNYFGRPNNKYSFDRFSSKLRPTNQGGPIDFTFKSPYDSLQNINAANFSALLAGGFSNGLIELASINNYLYYVEKFLTTNQIDNAKINDSLYALSNMVGRIDSYVTEDFSNEFFNLCRTIEGLTNSFDSVLGSMTNSNNDLNLSLTNIEISLETIITNQLKSLSFYSAFSNQFNTVISNQTLFSDYLFNSDNVLTEYTDGSYYDFLTNRYITGSSGSLSNWYERIETLLAALTFSAVSQSNLTTQVDNEDDLKQRFQDILTQSVNENTQTSIIKTANDSQGAIINIVRGLSSTISSVASQHSIVFGWGDNETVKFEDFVGGNFHITVSGHGVDQFTMVGRAVSTLCWIVVTCLLVFKFSLWMARVGYKLYTFIRSVLFALWGK